MHNRGSIYKITPKNFTPVSGIEPKSYHCATLRILYEQVKYSVWPMDYFCPPPIPHVLL